MHTKWWDKGPRRLIQTNLNERDITDFNLENYIQSLEEFSADTVIFNTGGIVANYETALPWHFRNPHLGEKDILGALIKALHERDIRFVARFDMSKINETLAPDYGVSFCRNAAGETLNYNGQVQVCVNSPYQQKLSLEILKEALGRYSFDGIFFNMPGYLTEDYSGNYFGLCQCEHCRKRFASFSDFDLPGKESPALPGYADYESFRKWTCDDLFIKIRNTVKNINEDIAIFNYAETGVDVYRQESNSSLGRPLPEWEYSAHENVSRVQTSWPHITAMNSTVHFIDYPFRFNAVYPALSALRTIQSLVMGSWLDFYVLGYLESQADQKCYSSQQELFSFHKQHEKDYSGTRSAAGCCIICPDYRLSDASMAEFRGLSRILTNSHIPFDVLDQRAMKQQDILQKLAAYSLILLADADLGADEWLVLEAYTKQGGKLISTGFAAQNPASRPLLGIDTACKSGAERAAYWSVSPEDRTLLKNSGLPGLLFLDGPFMNCTPAPGTRALLRKTEASTFGPPEKCFTGKSTNTPGVLVHEEGKGLSVYIPWALGTHYETRSYHGHAELLQSLICNLSGYVSPVDREGRLHPLIQVFLRKKTEKSGRAAYQLSLVNHTGQSGTAFFSPVPFTGLEFTLNLPEQTASPRCLRGGEAEYNTETGTIKLNRLNDFETIIFEEKQ